MGESGLGHPFVTLCSAKAVVSPHCARVGDEATHTPQLPTHPRPPRLSGENRGYGAEPRNQPSGRGAQRRRPRASRGLAARPHVAGPRGGGTGAEGEGLHLREVPGWSRPPALSAFPARRLSPPDRGEVSRKKMPGAPRGAGAARSRCAVRDALRGLRGLKAVSVETPTAAGTPGGWGAGLRSAAWHPRARAGRRGRRAASAASRGRPAPGGARPWAPRPARPAAGRRPGDGGAEGPRTAGPHTRRLPPVLGPGPAHPGAARAVVTRAGASRGCAGDAASPGSGRWALSSIPGASSCLLRATWYPQPTSRGAPPVRRSLCSRCRRATGCSALTLDALPARVRAFPPGLSGLSGQLLFDLTPPTFSLKKKKKKVSSGRETS